MGESSVRTTSLSRTPVSMPARLSTILIRSSSSPKRSLSSGLTDSAAIPPPKAPKKTIDPGSFTGRFAALWGVTDVFILGGKLLASSPVGPSPVVQPYELAVIDENTLRIMKGSPYGSVGEHFRYERDEDGKIISVFTGGMKAWPIEDYRARTSVL